MARKMPVDQLEVYRGVMETQWFNEQGETTAFTTDVYGPYARLSSVSSSAWGSVNRHSWRGDNYYEKPDGSTDYSRPKKRRTLTVQKLGFVMKQTNWADGRQEVSADLIWEDIR